MTRIWGLALMPFVLAGCQTGVEGGNGLSAAENSENFDAALISIGCDLRFESDYLAMEIQTGMSREELQTVVARKAPAGEVVTLAGGGVRSNVGACKDGGTPVAAGLAPATAS